MNINLLKSKTHIKQVPVDTILPLRRTVLRPGKTLEESQFEGDLNNDTFHLALIANNEVKAIATYIKISSKELDYKTQYRLRGMAVSTDARGKGFGKKIFQEGLKLLQEKSVDILWFNARKTAVPFYEKLGCKKWGNEFNIPQIGPHFLMIKEL